MTAVEIVVVLICLVLIIALAIPYVASTRESARNAQSLRNLQELSAATLRYAEVNGDRFPLLVDGDGTSWPAQLLPYLGSATPSEAVGGVTDGSWLPVFVAPSDPRAAEAPQGSLSYAANSGYGRFEFVESEQVIREVGEHTAAIDLDDDGEVSERERLISYSTGVVWRPGEDEFRVTTDFVRRGDGLEMTLLLAENFSAGRWLSDETTDLAFVIGRDRLAFEGGPAGPTPLKLDRVDLGPFAVGAIPDAPAGGAPRPIALPGTPVHVAFCDGGVRPLSPDIDGRVYAQLLTPNGNAFGEAALPPTPPPRE